MTVSMGFYKIIKQWVIDHETGNIAFQPFQTDGNPYKSKVFLVGASPELNLDSAEKNLKLYADSLVDGKLFQETFAQELQGASREYKGCLNFISWMKEHYNENVVLTNVNCLSTESAQMFKQMKKHEHPLYKRGLQIFEEVLNEFAPEIVILQGSSAYKAFIEQFGDRLDGFEGQSTNETVQQLEQKGVLAKIPLKNGKIINIIVSRSMSYFGKEGNSFVEFKSTINRILQ